MNANQTAKYGRLQSYTDVLRRHCNCPYCPFRASVARRGRGAWGAINVVQGMVMTHIRERHADQVTDIDTNEEK